MLLTIQPTQIEALAPNDNAIKAARKLATLNAWNHRGSCENQWIWGEIEGSSTYQSAIYLPELKCECSCPSFKRPCKHALALMYVYADHQDQFTLHVDSSLIPARVQTWQNKIKPKPVVEKEPSAPVEDATRLKRRKARELKMNQGIELLTLWLHDIAHIGLAQLRSNNKNDSFAQIRTRLVDAQAAGLNGWLDEFSSALYQEHWQQKSQYWLAKLYWFCTLWQQRQHLSSDAQYELQLLLGLRMNDQDWSETPTHELTLHSVATYSEEFSHSTVSGLVRRQWLWDEKHKHDHLVLDYKVSSFGSFGGTVRLQQKFSAQVQYYPSVLQQRLALNFDHINYQPTVTAPAGFSDFAEAFAAYRHKLAQSPIHSLSFWWIEQLRFYYLADGQCTLIDQNNNTMPISLTPDHAEKVWLTFYNQAFSAGVEWNGLNLRLVNIWQGENYLCLL